MTDKLEALITEMKTESDNNGGMFLYRPDIAMLIDALNKHRSDLKRATDTLIRLGYTDCGGELWKPPLGDIPAWVVDLEHVAYIHSEGDYLDSQEVIEAIEKAGGTVKRGDL